MSQTAFILVITADEERGAALRQLLRERHGQSCNVVPSFAEALNSIRQRTPDAVVADSRVGDASDAQSLADLLDKLAPDAVLVWLGESGTSPTANHIQLATLPDDDLDNLAERVVEAADKAVLRQADRRLEKSLDEHPPETFEGIVGTSPPMMRIIERIKKAARNKLTVLILGETGTGKDLIAEAIHKRSDRARRAMKSVNCAGLNENLLESELFGHVKGAFTGAVTDRKGYFVAADGGTLFLDEIGDMPLNMQAKLLRVLERREVTPVGSTEVQRVDVRVIAATHADLFHSVEDREFREDLYYRLKQWVIDVPPLRERREDIPLLAVHFLRRANAAHGLSVPGISSEAMGFLARHYWPGNVRELANLIESTAVEAENRRIEAGDLPDHISSSRDLVPASGKGLAGLTMAQIERIAIERALQTTGGNREQAAKMLDIGTRTLYRKIKEYGLQ